MFNALAVKYEWVNASSASKSHLANFRLCLPPSTAAVSKIDPDV